MKKIILIFTTVIVVGQMFIRCSGIESEPRSSDKQIIAFGFTQPFAIGIIDEVAKTIIVKVPFGTDVLSLTPIIRISSMATVNPESSIPQNFTEPVIYTVMAEDSSTTQYTVIINKEEEQEITIIGKTWVLVEKESGGIKEMLPENDVYPITITFLSDTTFHGRHDANVYKGTYNRQSDNISLLTTFITDVGDIEWYLNYINQLPAIGKITVTDSTMLLLNSNKSLMLNFVSKEKFERDYFQLEEWYNF